jgi:hypothetical protein
MPEPIKIPGVKNRTTIMGRTGTGKTVAALWLLSKQDLSRPWLVLNYKNDEHIDSIENTVEVGLDWKPGKKSRGLNIVRPKPRVDDEAVNKLIYRIWEHERCGIFCDELFMVQNHEALDACYTQGRSKEIPIIGATQRPVWITRFAFSEASYLQIFDLNDKRDIQTVECFVPLVWDEEKPLERHQSWYYEIDNNYLVRLNPVPDMDKIRANFAERLDKRHVFV